MKRAAAGAFALTLAAACDADFRFDPVTDDSREAGASTSDGGTDSAGRACIVDSDCPLPSLHCDTTSGACLPCVLDSQCSAQGRPRCDLALHACVECGSNQDCGFNATCEPLTRKCVPRCADNAPCPASVPRCGELGFCSECANSGDCPAARHFCEKPSGRCVECRGSADCSGARPRCDSAMSRCVGCVLSTDCPPAAPVCDPATSACVTP